MSRLSDLQQEYNEYKTDYKQVKFGRLEGKCNMCNKTTKSGYHLQLYVKGDTDCGCIGIGCNNCRMEEEIDFAFVCSERCETMLILRLME
jgi:hypothetical protein